jgi:S-adenosylmethionine hydrolase
VETRRGFFVGPDNVLLVLAAEAQKVKQVRVIESRRLMLPHVSDTFHGRDVFAPVAAHLANGVPLEEFGPPITQVVKPDFVKVTRTRDALIGKVLYIDGFGNIITNIPAKDFAAFRSGLVQIELPLHKLTQMKFSHTYADAKPQEPLILAGSHTYIEIALNQGSAAQKFGVRVGDKVTVS